jgi:hypothetical protein
MWSFVFKQWVTLAPARHPIYGSFTLIEWDAGPVPIALVAFTVNV